MSLHIMPGRTADIKNVVGNSLLEVLRKHFAGSLQELNLQITLEIKDLQTYFKITA
jgi:5-carboxymethyl-2-hydroxymuconate isomerase